MEKNSAKTPEDRILEISLSRGKIGVKTCGFKKKKLFSQSGSIRVDGVERNGRILFLVDLVFHSRL